MTKPPLPEWLNDQVNEDAAFIAGTFKDDDVKVYDAAVTIGRIYAARYLSAREALEVIRDTPSLRGNPLEIRRFINKILGNE